MGINFSLFLSISPSPRAAQKPPRRDLGRGPFNMWERTLSGNPLLSSIRFAISHTVGYLKAN